MFGCYCWFRVLFVCLLLWLSLFVDGTSGDTFMYNLGLSPGMIVIDTSDELYVFDASHGRIVNYNHNITTQQQLYRFPTSYYMSYATDTQYIYIADPNNQQIIVFNQQGIQQRIISTPNLADASLNLIVGQTIDIDTAGNIYYVDGTNKQIVKLNNAGIQQQTYTTSPYSTTIRIKLDHNDNLYIIDVNGNQTIQYNNAGQLQHLYTANNPSLNSPRDVAIDAAGNVYIVDTGNNRIVTFNSAASQTSVLTVPASTALYSVAIDSQSYIYVIASYDNTVNAMTNTSLIRFNPTHTQQSVLLSYIPYGEVPYGLTCDMNGNLYTASPLTRITSGGVPTPLSTPVIRHWADVAIDTQNNLYITDLNNNQIIKLDPMGQQILQIYTTTNPPLSLSSPTGLAVDTNNNIYVIDNGNYRLVIFNSIGSIIQIISSLLQPSDVVVDSLGNIYIAESPDYSHARVRRFNQAGVVEQSFVYEVRTPIYPITIYGITIDNDDNIYMAIPHDSIIVQFDTHGIQQHIYSYGSMAPVGMAACNHQLYVSDLINVGNLQIFTINTTTTTTTTGSITGDPQFVGFQGQHFQVHGTPDEHFALISSPHFYINSRFVYLTEGSRERYNDTAPFSHPGTYIDRLSIVMKDTRIELHAGPHHTGMSRVVVNGESVDPGTRVDLPLPSSSLDYPRANTVIITLSMMSIEIVNSHHFFNLGVALTDMEMRMYGSKHVSVSGLSDDDAMKVIDRSYPSDAAYQLHGLLGQTWRNVEYAHRRVYQGVIDDYLVANLFDPNFVYSLYNTTV